jgi:hypothetical protein
MIFNTVYDVNTSFQCSDKNSSPFKKAILPVMRALEKTQSLLLRKLPAGLAKEVFETFVKNDDMNEGFMNLTKLDHFLYDNEIVGEVEEIARELGDSLRVMPFHVLMMSIFDIQQRVPILNLFYENENVRSFESFHS